MARAMCKKHGIPLFDSIEKAVTVGGTSIPVDGVLSIGEHGNYPNNEKGQKLYPRFEFFQQVARVFEEDGRSVPVFNDKHLSYSFEKAKAMVDTSRRLKFPMQAGSSIPVTWRLPALDLPVLVANGAHDVMVHAFHSWAMSQRLPQAELVLYPDAGHGFLFQHVERFAAHVHGFLGEG